MEFIFIVATLALVVFLVFRNPGRTDVAKKAALPPDPNWEPQIPVSFSDDRAQYSEARIAELLRQLEEPYGYWTYANVPPQLEIEMHRLLDANPDNRVALALKERMPRLKRDCATKMVLMRVQDLSERAELATTVATKQKNAKEALVTIEAAIAEGLADPTPLRDKIPALRRYVAQVEIDGFTEKAKRFEFKGNLKKALEYYQDALYSAIHDDVDDAEQQQSIQTLTAKVEELTALIAQSAEEKKAAKRKPAEPAA